MAGDDIGGDSAERQRVIVEVCDRALRREQPLQLSIQPLPAENALRQRRAAVAEAQPVGQERTAVLALAAKRQLGTRQRVAEDCRPRDTVRSCRQLCRVVAARVQAADHRAHAGAADHVDRDVALLEFLDDANVREALGTAAAKHQPDARTRSRRSGCDQQQHQSGTMDDPADVQKNPPLCQLRDHNGPAREGNAAAGCG